ncbi:MAG: hypothetical protein ACI4I9_01725 [Porcipelethomonas sp.]
MGIDIDKLNIEISGNADEAVKGIDRLTAALDRLEKSMRKSSSAQQLAKSLEKIALAADKFSNSSASDKINKFADSLGRFTDIKTPNMTKLLNCVKKLSEAGNTISGISGTENLSAKVSEITSALSPLENMGKNTLTPFLNSLKKLPETAKALKDTDIDSFSADIASLSSALSPLINQVERAQQGLVSLNGIIKTASASGENLTVKNKKLSDSYSSLSSVLTPFKVKLFSTVAIMKRAASEAGAFLTESNDYIENLNLFTVAMGENSKAALDYAETVNKALHIDTSEFIRNQGTFKQITSGYGVAEEKADLMSKNLTTIGYDMASFFNSDTETAMEKLQSAISGEIEPLRRWGYALDQTTLQQTANNHGITESITNMTQAQKSQLRYIAIMEQSKNVTGDMARTIITPANSMRILEQQITQLKRAIGNIISVVAVKVIPYLQAFIRLITEAADALAEKWGFELPKIDYTDVGSGMSTVTDNLDEMGQTADETVKKIQRLAGFDEINVLSSGDSDSGTENSGLSNSYDLDIDLPEYDFLSGLSEQSDGIYNKLKGKIEEIIDFFSKLRDIAGKVAGLIAGMWILGKLPDLLDKVKKLKDAFSKFKAVTFVKTMIKNFADGFKEAWENGDGLWESIKNGVKNMRDHLTPMQKFGIGIAGFFAEALVVYDAVYDAMVGEKSWKTALLEIIGISALVGTALTIALGPIGLVITAAGAAVGAIKAMTDAEEDNQKAFWNTEFYDNTGISLDTLKTRFNDVIDPIKKSNDRINELYTTFSDNQKTVEDAIDKVDGLTQKFVALGGELNDGDVEEIRAAVEEIYEATKENLELATNIVTDVFKQSFHDCAEQLGLDVDNMLSDMYLLQSAGDKALSEIKSQADSVVDSMIELSKSSSPTKKEQFGALQNELNGLLETMSAANNVTEAEVAYREAINSVQDNVKNINFESEEEFTDFINDLVSSGQEAQKSVEDTKIQQLTALESLKSQYKALGLDKWFDEMKGETGAFENLFEGYDSQIRASYEKNKSAIDDELGSVLGALQTSFDSKLTNLAQNDNRGFFLRIKDNFIGSLKGGNILKAEIYGDQEMVNRLDEEFSPIQEALDGASAKLHIKPNYEMGKDLLDSLGTVKSDAKKKAEEIAPEIGEGYSNGMFGISPGIENTAKQVMGTDPYNAVKDYNEINSPSKLYKRLGVYLPAGFAVGISNNAGAVTSALKNLLSGANSTFKSNLPNTKSYGTKIMGDFSSGISNGSGNVRNILGMTVSGLETTVSANLPDLKKYGTQIMGNFASGISQGGTAVTSALINPAGAGVFNRINNTFNTSLPDLSFYGNRMMAGFASAVISQTQAMADRVIAIIYDMAAVISCVQMRAACVMSGSPAYGSVFGTVTGIRGYAGGGFPSKGELFMAREKGPELVGRIGNKTAVMNNGQIIDGIYQAAYSAFRDAQKTGDSQPVQLRTTVQLNERVLGESVTNYQLKQNMKK